MKLQLVHEQYARVLRAIGQDLSSLFPDRLEIDFAGRYFVARGFNNLETPRTKEARPCAIPRDAQNTPCESQPSRSEFVRTYTAEDIDRLDKLGASHRKSGDRLPDLHSLPERLRIIGRIVDGKNAELVKLCQETNTVKFEYRDQHGNLHSEAYSSLTVHKLQQQYYSHRRIALKDAWRSVPK